MPRIKEFEPENAVGDAMAVFWETGYEAASVQELLDAMGINRGSMYDTFGDKRSLFLDALQQYANQSLADLEADFDQSESPMDDLEQLLRTLAKGRASDRGCLLLNTAVELGDSDPDVSRIIRTALGRMERLLRSILDAATDAGDLPVGTDTKVTARYLQTIMFGLRVAAKAGLPRGTKGDTVAVVLAALRRSR